MSDEGKRITSLVIDGAVIGLTAVTASKVFSMLFPKALPIPRLAFAPYDLTMDIVYLSLGRHLCKLFEVEGVFPD